jgi:hypothetical protein
MDRGLSAALTLGALCLFGATSAAAEHAAPLDGSASFADPAGDSGAAPDVTSVTVANDDKGLVTFRVAVANRTSLGPDDAVAVAIGTDDPHPLRGRRDDGINFVLLLDATGAALLEWNGQEMIQRDRPPSSVTASFSGGVATLTVKQEDLAPGFPDVSVPISMQFYVLGILFSGSDTVAQDDAPAGASTFWSYRLVESVRLIVTNFDAAKTVRAGKSFRVLLGIAHGETGAPLGSGRVVCAARVGSKTLKARGKFMVVSTAAAGQRFRSPSASCTWKIPKASKRKTLRGSIAVTESGITVRRTFATRVH